MELQKTRIILIAFLLQSVGILSGFSQQLGANFNENIDKVSPALISKTNSGWVRGFLNIPALCLNMTSTGTVTGVNESAIQNMTRLDNLANAKTVTIGEQPVKMIFSLKMAFTTNNMGVPTAGTTTMNYVMTAIEKVLNRNNFGSKIDILVVGNEPMWETDNADADKYEIFLNLLIDKVDSMRTANNWNYEIFAGAINKASQNTTNAILKKVMKVAIENPKVVGLDMHEHITLLSEAESDLRFIRNSYKFTKKLIATEFSLVWLWGNHASDQLGTWGTQNGYSSSTKMYECLNQLIQKSYNGTPVSAEHFISYFKSNNWYQEDWFYRFYQLFKKYDFSQVTYGIQNLPVGTVLTSSSVLWTLNFACNGTYLGTDSDKLGKFNPLVYPYFKQITDSVYHLTSVVNNVKMEMQPFMVAPIPAKNFITITPNSSAISGDMEIFSLNGQKIFKSQKLSFPFTLNFNKSISSGTYLLKINTIDNKTFTQKIIIE